MKDVGAKRALRITRNLSRTVAKWQRERKPVTLSDPSLHLLLSLLQALTKYQGMGLRKRSSSSPPKADPYLQLLEVATKWTLASGSAKNVAHMLQLIGGTEESHVASLTELYGDEFNRHLHEIVARAMEYCD
jgi:hypothetical protein